MTVTEITHTYRYSSHKGAKSPPLGSPRLTANQTNSGKLPRICIFFVCFVFNGDNQEENTGQTVSHDSRQLSVKPIQQSRLYWCLEPQDGRGNKQGHQSIPPPSGASQHPSQFGQTDALGAQRNPRHASLRETQQKGARAQCPD